MIAGSAGGITAANDVLSELPVDFPAAVVVVQHRSGGTPGVFEQILQTATRLRGAARVRDLFAQAESLAPSIIFIDELDALGKVRVPSAK